MCMACVEVEQRAPKPGNFRTLSFVCGEDGRWFIDHCGDLPMVAWAEQLRLYADKIDKHVAKLGAHGTDAASARIGPEGVIGFLESLADSIKNTDQGPIEIIVES